MLQSQAVRMVRQHARPVSSYIARPALALLLLFLALVDGVGGPVSHVDAAGALVADTAASAISSQVALAADGPVQGPAAPAPVVRATVAPPSPLDPAEAAYRLGDYGRATSLFRDLANSNDKATANAALVRLGVVQIDAGRFDDAATSMQELLGRDVDASTRAQASFLLGRARRAAGSFQDAVAAFDDAQKAAPDFGPYTDLEAAYCYAGLNDRPNQNARAGKALAAAEARLTKIDALEHQVTARLKAGDRDGALAASDDLLTNAGTRNYRAQTLTSLGTIAQAAEYRDRAIKAYATVIAELPETPSAVGALDALAGMNALNAVAPDEPPIVSYFAGRASDAIAGLRSALQGGLSPERTARAHFYLGQALLRLDAVDDGVSALRQVASDLPGSDLAARALLRAGRRLEADRRYSDATDFYRQAAETLPSSPAAQEAQARLVLVLVMRGAAPEALQAAQALADSGADGIWKGLGMLWASKALNRAGDKAQASAVLARSAEIDGDGFGGLRAREILDGNDGALHKPAQLDPAVTQPSPDDLAGLEGWLNGGGLDSATLDREQAGDPAYQRAALLYRVGVSEWASWELQWLAERWQADPGRLYGLARFAADRGDTSLAMRLADTARKATNAPISAQPRLVQRLIYPLPYADAIAANAKSRNVDPLLFAGLIRQESSFNPTARSAANALGLAQVVPSTGQGIAAAIGRPIDDADLYKPMVAIDFGTYYLSRQLGSYQGRIFPALAAYNAGGGAVNGWLQSLDTNDPDLFIQLIPFAETSRYVQVVYENYLHYRQLYR